MKRRFAVVVFVFVVSIYCVYVFEFINKNKDSYSGIAGNILATVFAAFLAWVAWVEWGKLSKTSSADFIHKLTKDFFTPEARTLIGLIECKALEFKEPYTIPDEEISSDGITESQPYFEVNQIKLNKSHLPKELIKKLIEKKFYASWEIDDFLLSPLEDVGMLERRQIVEFKMVYSGFSYYLKTVLEYAEIVKYLKWMSDDNETNFSVENVYYGHAQYIALKCQEYDDLHGGPCKCWWTIKRQVCGLDPKIKKSPTA